MTCQKRAAEGLSYLTCAGTDPVILFNIRPFVRVCQPRRRSVILRPPRCLVVRRPVVRHLVAMLLTATWHLYPLSEDAGEGLYLPVLAQTLDSDDVVHHHHCPLLTRGF
jgi:hypothetical protein